MLFATTLCDLKVIQLPQFTGIALRSLPTLNMALVKGQNVIKMGKKWPHCIRKAKGREIGKRVILYPNLGQKRVLVPYC